MGAFLDSIFEKLRRHPKRIVFPEGENVRVLEAAVKYVELKLGPSIVLGNRERIMQMAEDHDLSLKRVLVIDPEKASDMPLFVQRLEKLNRYKGISNQDARTILLKPNYFAAMMLQNGQCDGLVGGASAYSGNILRPLFQLIKPLPGIKSISSCMIMESDDSDDGDNGTLFFSDAGVIPNPNVEQLADIAVETGRVKRQLTGRRPRVALLSYSTKGSAQTSDTEKVVAATALAKQKAKDMGLEMEIDGELQVDTALQEEIARRKAPDSKVAGQADVLIFPDLNSGNIATKLITRLAPVSAYGQILTGLSKPAAEVSRGIRIEDLVGVAAIVAIQAIEYRKLYPEQYESEDGDE